MPYRVVNEHINVSGHFAGKYILVPLDRSIKLGLDVHITYRAAQFGNYLRIYMT